MVSVCMCVARPFVCGRERLRCHGYCMLTKGDSFF